MRVFPIRTVLFDYLLTGQLIVVRRYLDEASLQREDAYTEFFVDVLGCLPYSVFRLIYETASISCNNHHEDERANENADDDTEREWHRLDFCALKRSSRCCRGCRGYCSIFGSSRVCSSFLLRLVRSE